MGMKTIIRLIKNTMAIKHLLHQHDLRDVKAGMSDLTKRKVGSGSIFEALTKHAVDILTNDTYILTNTQSVYISQANKQFPIHALRIWSYNTINKQNPTIELRDKHDWKTDILHDYQSAKIWLENIKKKCKFRWDGHGRWEYLNDEERYLMTDSLDIIKLPPNFFYRITRTTYKYTSIRNLSFTNNKSMST